MLSILKSHCLCSQSEQNVVLQLDILVSMCGLAVNENYCNIEDVMYFCFTVITVNHLFLISPVADIDKEKYIRALRTFLP